MSQPDNDYAVMINVDGIQTAENRNADNGGPGYISAAVSVVLDLNAGQEAIC